MGELEEDSYFKSEGLETKKDKKRAAWGAKRIWTYMQGQVWRSLKEISDATGVPEASASACLRAFRRKEWGSHTVEKERQEEGYYLYAIFSSGDTPNWTDVESEG